MDKGNEHLLPPNEHCVNLLPQFRKIPPLAVPLDLDFIFPMTHPGHHIVGTNHRSDADVHITIVMLVFYLEMLRPPCERSLISCTYATSARQPQLDDQQAPRCQFIDSLVISKRRGSALLKTGCDTKEIKEQFPGLREHWRKKNAEYSSQLSPEARESKNKRIRELIGLMTPEAREKRKKPYRELSNTADAREKKKKRIKELIGLYSMRIYRKINDH